MEVNYSHWLAIAAVHATIIAIFIGASFAYLLFLHGRLDELANSVYQEANKINRFRFAKKLNLKIEEKYVASDDQTRQELIRILMYIGLGIQPDYAINYPAGLSTDKKERGLEAIKIIDALSSYYPFPQRVKAGPKGELYIFNKPVRVQFTSLDDVSKWRNDIYLLTSQMSWLWNDHREEFLDTINAVMETHNKFFENENISPEVIVDTFFKNIFEAQRIGNSTEEKLTACVAYQKRTQIKKPLIIFLFFGILTFALGVFFPVVGWIFPRRIVSAFLLSPFVFYFFLFAYLFYKVLSYK